MHSSAAMYHYFADGKHESLMLAQEIHEAALLLPWQAGAEAKFGEDVYDLYDLDGKSYSIASRPSSARPGSPNEVVRRARVEAARLSRG